MRRRLYVHVGAPKTGTTYLQNRLTANMAALAELDVHYLTRGPLATPNLFQFRAALDLLGRTDWRGPIARSEGAWDALVRRVRRSSGTLILSHEILADAKPKHVARLWRDLDVGESTELHVVYTARDLARQLPAAWQEGIKQGQRWTFENFLKRFQAEKMWFYRVFRFPTVLTTWGADLPPERIHLVTVPGVHTAVPRDELWRRFAAACGFDPAWAPREGARSNRSLGMAETQVIRRLNRRLERSERPGGTYDRLIRVMLAEDVLVHRDSDRVRLPPALHPWVAEVSERWIEWAQQSRIDVIGDLDDLRPPAPDPDTTWHNPDRVRPRLQLQAALDALAAMTAEAARREDPDLTLGAKVKRARERLVGP
ncbi:hypothetical protein P5P86_02320 [Nocardioides sp. BP30]|uniref:hypothetical protein n=1 Tax=Nocardioides sp. BP30 TaxID=3036374 RepID=UPI0024683244|nr:hypothetical protein [Nocardioides sp. BP30]WGL52669.1 hypothetical protein P5P86_02320 [Nocardioides sp. BP30]